MESYSVQLNGNTSRSPPWPNPQLKNEKIFILPKKLDTNDTIVITGTTYDQRKRLTIGLVTGFEAPDHNVAYQLDINFYDPNNILQQVVQDGSPVPVSSSIISDTATGFFSDPLSFQVKFTVRKKEDSERVVVVDVGNSNLTTLNLEYKLTVNGNDYEIKNDVNTIRFLTVYGDVEKVSRLDFNFG